MENALEEQMEIIEDHPPLNSVAMFDVMGPCWRATEDGFRDWILSQRQPFVCRPALKPGMRTLTKNALLL